jgi:hypothetical protein
MSQIHNPLKQFFRQPSIYLKLPSGGKHWPTGSLEMPANNEIPVYPMTAIDEITYRTPDALFNGQAVINVIQSCVPAIKNAWHTPNVDLNALLVAIRIASYGHEMELSSTCPSCQHQNEYSIDLRVFLEQIECPDYNTTIHDGELEICFKAVDYEQQTQTGMMQFEQQKILSLLPDSELSDDDKMIRLNQAVRQITELTILVISKSIAVIKGPGFAVTDSEHIEEFLKNCDRRLYQQIRDHAVKLNQDTQLKNLSAECEECHHKYEQPTNLDLSSFFDSAS